MGQGANFFLQAAFFLLLTRLLGVTEYGDLQRRLRRSINLATPYSSLGAGMLFMPLRVPQTAPKPACIGATHCWS